MPPRYSYAHNFGMMIIGRALLGFSVGISCGTSPAYVAEIVTPGTRGILGTFFQILICFGQLYMNVFGLFLEWNTLCYVALVPVVLGLVGMILAPESPIELIEAGKLEEARRALQKIRKPMSDVETEHTELRDKSQTSKKKNENQSAATLIVRPDVYKPIVIAILLMFFQQFSGINAVMFYLSDIFNHSSGDSHLAVFNGTSNSTTWASITTEAAVAAADAKSNKVQWQAIGVNFALVFTTVLSGFIIDRLGRKILLIISGAGHVISLVIMGLYYYKKDDWFEGATWLPIVCLIVFVCFFSIGYGPIPWMIISELTPNDAMSLVSSIGTAFNWLCAFIVTKEFDDIQKGVHDYGAYWIFAGISLVSVVYTTLMVPETKHRTIEDMQRYFLGQR